MSALSRKQKKYYFILLLVIGIITLGTFTLFCLDLNSWYSKDNEYKKNIKCANYCSNEGEEEFDNYGEKDYPYVVTLNEYLCFENATEADIITTKASKFSDADKVRKEFAENGLFYWDLRNYILCSASGVAIWLFIGFFLSFYAISDFTNYLHIRAYGIYITFYWAYYWLFLASPYYLVMSIKYENCLQIENPKDFDILFEYKKNWLGLFIMGIIFPAITVILAFALIIAAYPEWSQKKRVNFHIICTITMVVPNICCMCVGLKYIIEIYNMSSTNSFFYTIIFLIAIFITQILYCFYPNLCQFWDWAEGGTSNNGREVNIRNHLDPPRGNNQNSQGIGTSMNNSLIHIETINIQADSKNVRNIY